MTLASPTRRGSLAPVQRRRLLEVIGRGAPFPERSGPGFRPAGHQDAARVAARSAVWCRAVGAHDDAALARVAAERGVSAERVAARFQDLEVDEDAMPAWAAALLELLERVADAPVWSGDAPTLATADDRARPLRGLLAAADQAAGELIASSGAEVDPGGRHGLVTVFGGRLWRLLDQLLAVEGQAAAATAGFRRRLGTDDAEAIDPVADWLDRLERAPVLAHLLGTTFRQWRQLTSELLTHLVADADLLRDRVFGGVDQGPLAAVQGDTGDIHNDGRAVAVLTFASGLRAVHKPKDLRISGAFYRLVGGLTGGGPRPALPMPAVLVRDGYAWEAFVAHEPCRDAAGAARFYRRMGMWLRLFQLLEGRDLWLDNLVARGDEPVFIDLETVLQPRSRVEGLSRAEEAALDQREESVVPTCVVTMPTPIAPGVRAEDLGALAAPRTYLSPFWRSDRPPAGGPTSPPDDRFTTWTHPEHAPVVDGVPVAAARHVDDLIAGYRAMHQRLLGERDHLLDPDGPMAALREAPVRFIVRDTWSYLRLARRSVAPAMLVDPVMREAFLEGLRVPGGASTASSDAARDRTWRVAGHEIDGLRVLDVPFFRARPDRDGLLAADGSIVEGYFDRTAWARVQARLVELAAFPLERHVALLRSCMASGHVLGPAAPPPAAATSASPTGRAGAVDWVAEAAAIAARVLGEGVRADGDPELAWIGLAFHPHIDTELVEVLRPDILSGSTGLAMLFADLSQVTGDGSWRAAAEAALAPTVRAASGARSPWTELRIVDPSGRPAPLNAGALYGMGSHVYGLRRCATALGSAGRPGVAEGYFDGLSLEALIDMGAVDLVSGALGLLLAMVAPSGPPSPSLTARAAALAERLAARWTPEQGWPVSDFPPATGALEAFPGRSAASVLLAARLGQAGGDVGRVAEADGARLLDRVRQGAATPGDMVAALEVARIWTLDSRDSAAVTGAARANLARATAVSLDTPGALDALETAFALHALTGDREPLEAAQQIATALLDRWSATGTWFPGTLAADRHRLSVVRGVPAIAHAFLRLGALESSSPGRPGVASIRLIG